MQNARKERHSLALALELTDTRRRQRVAVLRNVSQSGLLVNTPSRFELGSTVDIRVHGADGSITELQAEVARVEECTLHSPEPWRYRLGLKLRRAWYDVRAQLQTRRLVEMAAAS